jgi:3-isopropylmalate/(R)-2-methylmalate dehydratase small subunit
MSSEWVIKGRIWILGDSIDTDLIVPSYVLTEKDPQKMASATLESIIPDFSKQVKPGDIIIGGKNFGCGSSREEAVFVLKTLGIKSIIATSFARIFYRNAINLGLPPVIFSDLQVQFPNSCTFGQKMDSIIIDLRAGSIKDEKKNKKWQFTGFPPLLMKILDAGGAIPLLLKQKLRL